MFKTLFFLFALSFSMSGRSRVEARWLTVSCIVLQDGETTLMFDPMFTRAGLSHWLNLSELRSDEQLVASVLKEQNLPRVDAVFASHSHFDHVIDAPMVSKLAGATFYTDSNSERVARAYKNPQIKTQLITNLKTLQVGKFKITPILRDHAALPLIHYRFLPGPIPEDFNFGFYQYHEGDTWLYYIEHPELKIVFDQGPAPHLDKLKAFTNQVDFVIQGVANRKSDEVVEQGYFGHLKPKIYMPIHFDNFFASFDPKAEIWHLPGMNLERLINKLEQKKTGAKIIVPKYGEKILLHE
jgi:L-ascorbate metabolism protein UlaG (beta-lactamase superfamily)